MGTALALALHYREWPEGVLLEGVQHFEKNKIQGVTAC